MGAMREASAIETALETPSWANQPKKPTRLRSRIAYPPIGSSIVSPISQEAVQLNGIENAPKYSVMTTLLTHLPSRRIVRYAKPEQTEPVSARTTPRVK